MNSWILHTPSYPACVVCRDPESERRCGAPAKGGRTILDWPLCDECAEAVAL